MPDAIIYCDSCNKIILPSEIETGNAIALKQGAMCASCLSKLDPAKRRALKEAIARVTPRHGLPTVAPPPAPVKSSGVVARPREGARRRTGGHSARGEREPASGGGGSIGIIVGVVAFVAVVGIAIVVTSGGSSSMPARRREPVPGPPPVRSEQTEREATQGGRVSPITGRRMDGWGGGVATGGVRTGEQEEDEEARLFYAQVAFDRARMHAMAHPFEYDKTIELYRKVVTEYADTKYAKRAEEAIRNIERERVKPTSGPPDDALSFGTSRYKLFDIVLTWPAARQFCEARDGHLVTITSREENAFVRKTARARNWNVWLGMTDDKHERRWEWVTGEPVVFGDWSPNNPSNSNEREHYAILSRDLSYRWDDRIEDDVGKSCRVVCEWDARDAPHSSEYGEDVSFEGHTYRVVAKHLSWHEAKRECEGLDGHLVTITSAREQELVRMLMREAGHDVWLGLTDEGHEGDWRWITGEPVEYTHWRGGEPNNGGDVEHFGEMASYGSYRWNDRTETHEEKGRRLYAICEWDEVRPGAVARTPQIPAGAMSFGGHWYMLYMTELSWHDAQSACAGLGGHLVTVTSREEHEFVLALVDGYDGLPWIGLSDEAQEGRWEWVTGEPVTFTAWDHGQPDNSNGHEDHAQIWREHGTGWNDNLGSGWMPYICEWESAD